MGDLKGRLSADLGPEDRYCMDYLHEDAVQRNFWWKCKAHLNPHVDISTQSVFESETQYEAEGNKTLLFFSCGILHRAIALELILF